MAYKSIAVQTESLLGSQAESLLSQHDNYLLPSLSQRLRRKLAPSIPNNLLRNIGLAVLGDYQQQGEEKPKVIIKHSVWTSLARCTVHLLPSIVSLILLVVNFGGFFIGTELAGARGQDSIKIATLQSCAKVQELLILASVSTLLLHFTRVELLAGQGMSIGLMTSSFSYSKLSYFWSPDFVGSIHGLHKAGMRRILFVGTTCVAGLLALFAGPATAVLMIPRVQDWPAGGTVFWVNGTQEDFWPEQFHGGRFHPAECRDPGTALGSDCAAAGYLEIFSAFCSTQHPHTSPFQFNIMDGKGQREAKAWLRDPGVDQDTWLVAPHVVVGNLQDRIRSFWATAISDSNTKEGKVNSTMLGSKGYSRFMHADQRTSRVNVSEPYVRTACSKRTEVYWNTTMANASAITVDFPVLHQNVSWQTQRRLLNMSELDGGPTRPLPVEQLFQEIVEQDASKASVVSIKYINSSRLFGNVSMGLLVARPMWDATNQWAVMGCAVDARWAESSSIIADYQTGALWNNVWYNSDSLVQVETQQKPPLCLTTPSSVVSGRSTSRLVQLHETWWNETSPKLPGEYLPRARVGGLEGHKANYNFSTTDWLLSNMDLTTRLDVQLPDDPYRNARLAPIFVEHILSTLIADAMARVNSRYTNLDEMSGIPNPINSLGLVRSGGPILAIHRPTNRQNRDLVQLVMEQTIRGYAFSVANNSDILAATVLLVHIFLALGHTLWVMWPWRRGIGGSFNTSDAWDSVVDWVALSLTSPAPDADTLSNVGGGARKASTMKKQFWIEADESKLQLVALKQEKGLPEQRAAQIKIGKKYS